MESGYFDGFNGSLFEWQRDYPGTLTTFGRQYRDYVLSLDEQYLGGGNQGHGLAENR